MAYKQRLLVVMPDGFGFNWPGHSAASAYRLLAPIRIGASLSAATQDAVRTLAAANGVKLAGGRSDSGRRGRARRPAPDQGENAPGGESTDDLVGIVVLALVAIGLGTLAVRRTGIGRLEIRRRLGIGCLAVLRPAAASDRPGLPAWRARLWSSGRVLAIPGGALLIALTAAAVGLIRGGVLTPAQSQGEALASNPYLDPGTAAVRPGSRLHAL